MPGYRTSGITTETLAPYLSIDSRGLHVVILNFRKLERILPRDILFRLLFKVHVSISLMRRTIGRELVVAMKDEEKTKEQLLKEIAQLRRLANKIREILDRE